MVREPHIDIESVMLNDKTLRVKFSFNPADEKADGQLKKPHLRRRNGQLVALLRRWADAIEGGHYAPVGFASDARVERVDTLELYEE